MNHPVTMALLLVEELRKRDVLEDVILANDIGNLRVCTHCGKLMNEGWTCVDSPYCSDKCLLADNPDLDLDNLAKMTEQELNASEIFLDSMGRLIVFSNSIRVGVNKKFIPLFVLYVSSAIIVAFLFKYF